MKIFLRRLLKIALWTLPILGAGAWFAIENVLPYWPIKPFRMTADRLHYRLPGGVKPEDYSLQAEPLTIHTRDSVALQAMYIPSVSAQTAASNTTMILLHGIGGCKELCLPAAKLFTQQGYNVLLFDLRAQGQSGGEYNTFGYREKYDVMAVVDTLLARDPNQHIGIFGNSLGGAIALQALAEDKRLRFGIIESTFDELNKVVEQYGANYFGFHSSWLAAHVLAKARLIAGFEPDSVKPYLSAQAITQPVFMAHGDKDERIPWSFGRHNFENLGSTVKQWYTVSGAGHLGMWGVGGAAYQEAMLAFLRQAQTDR